MTTRNLTLTPIPTDEEKPLAPTSIYAMTKRHQEEMCLLIAKPTAFLLLRSDTQRLRLKTSPLKPMHRMRSHLHKPHTQQQTTLHLRGWKPNKRLHPRKRHSKSKPKRTRTQQRKLQSHKHRNRKTHFNKGTS